MKNRCAAQLYLNLFLLLVVATSLSAEEAKGKAEGKSESPIALQDNFGDAPTFIKSDSLALKSEERVFVYSGNVEVKQGDMTLTADTLEGKYSKDNKIEQLVAKNNVVILKGADIRGSGEKALYDAATETVSLTESPQLQQKGSVLTADLIKIFLKENRSEAQGAVRVKVVQEEEGKNEKGGGHDLHSVLGGK